MQSPQYYGPIAAVGAVGTQGMGLETAAEVKWTFSSLQSKEGMLLLVC